MRSRVRILLLLAGAGLMGLTGCGSLSGRLEGDLPRTRSIVPDSTVRLTPSFGIALEKIVFWGAYAGAAYLILDPLAPNWEIEETPLPGNHIHLSMKMKRFYTGGAGEARAVFQRRARSLAQYGGFDGFDILEYTEGLDSSILGSQRVTTGVIRLSGKGGATTTNGTDGTNGTAGSTGQGAQGVQSDQGKTPPARNTSDKATNPLS